MTHQNQSAIRACFKAWDNGLSCDSPIEFAIVDDAAALLAKIDDALAIIEQHAIVGVRLNWHPDAWVGSDGGDDDELHGLDVTSRTFTLTYAGYVGTLTHSIQTFKGAIQALADNGDNLYLCEELEAEEVMVALATRYQAADTVARSSAESLSR